jgi:two-component system sensor histidine kinase RegB
MTAVDPTIPWLVRLRWAALVALIAGGWGASVFWGARLPLLPLGGLLLALAATNWAMGTLLRAGRGRTVIGVVLLIDVAVLTGVLYLAGGPTNPFSIVYLVGVTTAAVVLGYRWAMSVAAASTGAYGLLFIETRPLDFVDPVFGVYMFRLHLWGMWAVVAAAAGLIAYFVSRMSAELSHSERELADARAEAARSERMAALFSLGAGAAHELATPLSTIQTAASELERALRASGTDATLPYTDYVVAIRREVDRCTNVLDQLSGRAASASSLEPPLPWPEFVERLHYRLGESLSRRLDIEGPPSSLSLPAPIEPLLQTLVALVRNGFDASSPDQRVRLTVSRERGLRIEVTDHGRGMVAEEVARAGEPFFTTKSAGGGLGLGLFLARSFATQMGGSLTFRSAQGAGTWVILDLPGVP